MDKFARPATDLAGIKDTAEQFGFCIVKGLFDKERMAEIESQMAAASQTGAVPDLLSIPTIRPVLLDPDVLKIANTLLGPQLVYYGETALNYEAAAGQITHNPYRVFHADARGTPRDINAPWDPADGKIYRGYRFGLYFRDYSRHSGGLKVAPGSHVRGKAEYDAKIGGLFGNKRRIPLSNSDTIKVPAPRYELYNIESEPGDLVIFSLRVYHSAGAARLKADPSLALHPQIENDLWQTKRQAFEDFPMGARNTMFFDYGAPCEEIDLYIKWRAWKLLRNGQPQLLGFDAQDVMRDAEAAGISLRYDKIVASIAKDPAQKERLSTLLSRNHEFSVHHSIIKALQ
jgi:ectoine hydroxylase-related dioxygenase (phytanoyl-CoA dioxygenase family)